MRIDAINLSQKLSLISEPWDPKIIARLNDYHVKIAKIEGEFVWHSHPETDELFFFFFWEMVMHLRDHRLPLKSGELCVVPAGVEHKPAADGVCSILMLEPAGTLNTGDAGGEHTIQEVDWI